MRTLLLDLLLELRNHAVHDLCGLGKVSVAFGNALLGAQILELRLLVPDLLDCASLVLPPEVHGIAGVLQIGVLAVDLLKTGLGGIVIFLCQCLLLDLQLHELSLYLIQLLGLAFDFHLQLAGCLIYQVYGLVGQEPVGDVTVRENRSGHKGIVLDTHTVVDLIAVLDSTKDGDGILDRRFGSEHGLETSFKSLVLLDVFAVLVQRCGTDGMKLSTCQGGLDEVGGIG